MQDRDFLRERLIRRPGRLAWEVGTGVIHSIGPLGELVSEPGTPPTFNEVVRSEAEILASRAAAQEKK